MLQAYQGYFREETLFYVDNKEVKIPPNMRVVINIFYDEQPQTPKHKHISLKERLKDFNGEYEFVEWDTGADVGIEVVE